MRIKLLTFAILLGTALALSGCGNKTIDVMKNITVSFSGTNTKGTAIISGTSDWQSDVEINENNKDKTLLTSLAAMSELESAIDYKITPSENLTNGDEVIVSASINNEIVKKYGYKFKAVDKKFIVEDLPEVQSVDVFEGVEIKYSGIAPNATAQIVVPTNSPYSNYISYELSSYNDISFEDTLTMTASLNEEEFYQAGYQAQALTKDFVVTDVSRYITSYSEIDETTLNSIIKECNDKIISELTDATGEKYLKALCNAAGNDLNTELENAYKDALDALWYASVGYHQDAKLTDYNKNFEVIPCASYVFNAKDNAFVISDKHTLVMMFEIPLKDNIIGSGTLYIPIRFNNLYINADGTIHIDLTNRSFLRFGLDFNKEYSELVTGNKADWIIEENNLN